MKTLRLVNLHTRKFHRTQSHRKENSRRHRHFHHTITQTIPYNFSVCVCQCLPPKKWPPETLFWQLSTSHKYQQRAYYLSNTYQTKQTLLHLLLFHKLGKWKPCKWPISPQFRWPQRYFHQNWSRVPPGRDYEASNLLETDSHKRISISNHCFSGLF